MRPDLAFLVGSRICHDLISPIGAISNGVELLSLTDGDTGAEMELINQSVQNANARIRYFRIAFGAAGPQQPIGRSEVLSILTAIAKGGRFTYYWQIEGDQERRLVRCALLILQCFETALPLGGDLQINADGDAWVLTAEGPRITINDDLWGSVKRPGNDFAHSAAQVQFALLPDVIAEAGRTLHLDITSDRITARF
ncbi:histidine phosphotransferase family protein [Loktanella agnita]|uniref:histidine phosphotransferase family protein n=1 Tax=Loktanella agnita TaxID=287097 RepID=UPI0039876CDC